MRGATPNPAYNYPGQHPHQAVLQRQAPPQSFQQLQQQPVYQQAPPAWYDPNQATNTPGLGPVSHYPSPPTNAYPPQQAPPSTTYGQYVQAPQSSGYPQAPQPSQMQQYQPRQPANAKQSALPYGQQFVPAQQPPQQQTYVQPQPQPFPVPSQAQAAPVAPTSFTGSLFTSINNSATSNSGGSHPSQNQMQQLFEAISTPDHEKQFEEYLSKWETYYTSYREYCRVVYDAATFAQYDRQFQAYMDYLSKYKTALANRRAARPPPPPPPPPSKPPPAPQARHLPPTNHNNVSGYPTNIPTQRYAPPPTDYAALRAPLRQPQTSSFGEARNHGTYGGILPTPTSAPQIRSQPSAIPHNSALSNKPSSGPQFLTKENAPPKPADTFDGSRATQRVGQQPQQQSFRTHTPPRSQAYTTPGSEGSPGSFFRKAGGQPEGPHATASLPTEASREPSSEGDGSQDEIVDDLNGWGAETPRTTRNGMQGNTARQASSSPTKAADLGRPVYDDEEGSAEWLQKRLREYTVEPFIDPEADARYAKMQEEKLIEELFKLRDFLPREPQYDMGLLGRKRYSDEPAPQPVVQLRPMDIPEDMDPNVAAGFDPNARPLPKEKPRTNNKAKEGKGFFGKNKMPEGEPPKPAVKPPPGNLRVLTQPDASHEDEEIDSEVPFNQKKQQPGLRPGLAGFAPLEVMMAAGLMRPPKMSFPGGFGVPFGMAGANAAFASQPPAARNATPVRPAKRPTKPSNLPPDAMEKAGHARNLMKALSQDRPVSVNELLCIINSVKTEALLKNEQAEQERQGNQPSASTSSNNLMIQPDVLRQVMAQLTGMSALSALLGQAAQARKGEPPQAQQEPPAQKPRQSRFEPAAERPEPKAEVGQPIQRLASAAPPSVPMFRGKPTHVPVDEEKQPVQTLQSTVKPSQAPDLSKLQGQPAAGQGQSIFRLGPPQHPSLILPPPTPVSEPTTSSEARNTAALRQIPLVEDNARRSTDNDGYDERRRDRRSRSDERDRDHDRRRRSSRSTTDRDRHRERSRERERRRYDDERPVGSLDRRESRDEERSRAHQDDLDRPYGERRAQQRLNDEHRAQLERRQAEEGYEDRRRLGHQQQQVQQQRQRQQQPLQVNNAVLNQLGMNEQQVLEAIERTKALFGSVMPNESSAKLMALLESAVFGASTGNHSASQVQEPSFRLEQPSQSFHHYPQQQQQLQEPFLQHQPVGRRFYSPPRMSSPRPGDGGHWSPRVERSLSPHNPHHPLDRLNSPRHFRHRSPDGPRTRDSPGRRFVEGGDEVYSKSSRDSRDREARESRRSPGRTLSSFQRPDTGRNGSGGASADSRAQGVLRGFFAKALANLKSPDDKVDMSRPYGPALADHVPVKKSSGWSDADRPSQQGQPQAVRCSLTPLEELIPRKKQQKRLVIILRGPPGSGKSAVAKKVKELEPDARILSIDDYFQVEQDEEDVDSRGRKTTKKVNVYRFDEKMEHKYRSELEKLFRRKIEDPHSTCIIVDAVNEKLTHFMDMVMYGTRNNFEVFVGEMPKQKPYELEQRSTHKRSASDIADVCRDWEATPGSCWRVDLTKLIVEIHKAEETAKNLPLKISMKFNVKVPAKSKWEAADEEAEAEVQQEGEAEWVEKPKEKPPSTEFKKKAAGVEWVEKSPSTSSADRSPNKSRGKNYRARSKSRSPDRKKR
ncbi:hypothetical protein RvY_16519 [Ramazzottius varieornatus]|uniref:YLP motif-containing protein 1 n=1 Tax=Ramazzottius varieornatus TaxID=947166 RepID=A0A1D1W1H9_RAMVA|nr:hypothetical protein RvY_16519 [Ramazzottius varieornatus]